MSKGLVFGIVMFVSVYLGLNWALTRPTESSVASNESVNNAASETIRQTAEFVKNNPNGFKPQLAGIKLDGSATNQNVTNSQPTEAARSNRDVLGFTLDSVTQQELWTDAGFEKFKAKIGDNATVAVQDLKQAWVSTELNDIKSRGALLEITNSLAKASDQPAARDMLINEAETYLKPSEHQNVEHGGRALQYYVTQEYDIDKMKNNLDKIGVPMIVIETAREPASAPGAAQAPQTN